MADTRERDARLDAAWLESMHADFEVKNRPEHPIPGDIRVARAAEFAAFQLGRIRGALEDRTGTLLAASRKLYFEGGRHDGPGFDGRPFDLLARIGNKGSICKDSHDT